MYFREILMATMFGCIMANAATATVFTNDILGYPEGCACIVLNIDEFLIINPDWVPVRAPDPEDGPFPPEVVF